MGWAGTASLAVAGPDGLVTVFAASDVKRTNFKHNVMKADVIQFSKTLELIASNKIESFYV